MAPRTEVRPIASIDRTHENSPGIKGAAIIGNWQCRQVIEVFKSCCFSRFTLEVEGCVHYVRGFIKLGFIDGHCRLDFGSRDHLDVDAVTGKR